MLEVLAKFEPYFEMADNERASEVEILVHLILNEMDSKKLHSNINKLKKLIPKKPKVRVDDFPKSISESLDKYLRKRTICVMRYAAWIYDTNNWPMPLYVDPDNIKIGILNECMFIKLGMNNFKYFDLFGTLELTAEPYELKHVFLGKLMLLLRFRKRKKLEYYDWLKVPLICKFMRVTNHDDFNIELFNVNYKYYKKKLFSNNLLSSKHDILTDIFQTYENRNYAACICTLYPLLDFVTREYFKTHKLDKDITSINQLFKAAGFTLHDIDNLKPGAATIKAMQLMYDKKITHEQWSEISKKYESNLGFAGVALSSFLHFSTKYYEYYRVDDATHDFLNRHAIIHGASNSYSTKTNVIKLFTYLYLMLELEPILKVVFNET